ncbi:MAG: VOC family protein [Pseudomonadota bacterium]
MKGLRTTIYKVPDLEAAAAWYADAFGAKPYFDEPFYKGFNIAGYELGLLPGDTAPTDKSDNVLSYWSVDDVAAEIERLMYLGAALHQEATNVGGPITVGSVTDPWGNVIGLIDNPDFKAE